MSLRGVSALVPTFIKRRYSAKFVVSILFVLVVIASVGAAGYVQVDGAVESDTRDEINATAQMQANSLGDWVYSLQVQTRSTADADELVDGDAGETSLHLSQTHDSLAADVGNLHLFDVEDETVIASTDSSVEDSHLSTLEEPWADADVADELTADHEVWISPASYESSYEIERVIAFATHVPGDSDRILVLTGMLDLRVDALYESGPDQSTEIVSVNDETVLESEDAEGEWNLTDVEEAHAGTNVLQTEDGMVHAYASVPGTKWVAVTSSPTEEAFAVRDTVGTTVLGIIGATFLALVLVSVVLGRQTVLPLRRLQDRASRMEDGDLDVDLETDRVDEIGQLYGAFDSMRNSIREHIDEVEAAREETERLNEDLERSADEYSEVMRACADGDFTRRMDADSESEAMEDVAAEFNEMIAEIERTTEELKAFAGDVAAASEQVTASTEEVRTASSRVSESVQAISDGADQQHRSLQAVDDEMGQLSSTVEEIASASNAVADVAERTARTGDDGREAADAAIEGMNEIEAESDRAVEEIEALEAEIERIDDLLEFITDLAKETNVLALNANIEASRAGGDDGDGFGVVAGEVKDLAEETKAAAEDIEEITEEIRTQTHTTAREVQRTSDQVRNHRQAVENAAEALEEVASYAEETNDGVQDISAATEQQAASTEEVVAMVDDAAAIAEETSAEAETVAAAAEEQTSSLTEVTGSIETLSAQASTLSSQLDQFETDAAVANGTDGETVSFDEAEVLTSDREETPSDGSAEAFDSVTDGPDDPIR